MMKKHLKQAACGVLAAAMVFSLAACKGADRKPGQSTASSKEASSAATSAVSGDVPVLGVESTEYDGFQYLYQEKLATESKENKETKKMESQNLAVFIPQSEYPSVQRTRARSDKMGLDFTVDIEPYFQYDDEDYTLAENLDYYLEDMFDPEYIDYEDLEVGKAVEDKATQTARAVVTYSDYDKYDETYEIYMCTYFVKQLDSGLKVLVEAKINSAAATGKLPDLIAELESFYGFQIEWDAAEAKKQAEAKGITPPKGKESSSSLPALSDDIDAAPVKNTDGTFTYAGLTFSLPEGWDSTDEEDGSFAPDGDASFSGCAIMIMKQYSGTKSSDFELFQKKPEALETILKSYVETSLDVDDSENIEFKLVENSPFGMAMKLSFTQTEGTMNAYFVFDDDGYMYVMMAADTESDLPAAAALEKAFTSAKKG